MGLDRCANFLIERATELFRKGSDEKAIELRKLAESMRKELEPTIREELAEQERRDPAFISEGGP